MTWALCSFELKRILGRISDVEPRLVCSACSKRGANVRPNFDWNIAGPISGMGYRVVWARPTLAGVL